MFYWHEYCNFDFILSYLGQSISTKRVFLSLSMRMRVLSETRLCALCVPDDLFCYPLCTAASSFPFSSIRSGLRCSTPFQLFIAAASIRSNVLCIRNNYDSISNSDILRLRRRSMAIWRFAENPAQTKSDKIIKSPVAIPYRWTVQLDRFLNSNKRCVSRHRDLGCQCTISVARCCI